jgi:micrococcal nuclease
MAARRLIPALVGLVGLCGCRGAAAAPTSSTPRAANATVEYVVDGDTLDVMFEGREERVRLIGIDTPETKKENTPVECFGPEATAYLQFLLPAGTEVRMERDVVGRDDFGRLLVYLYRTSDGLFVNHSIVLNGFATTLTIPPNDLFADDFADAARQAERGDVGLWAACPA